MAGSTSWSRRLVTIPTLFIATAVYAALSPLLFVLAALADVARRRQRAALRLVAYLGCYLLAECVGVVALAIIGLGARRLVIERTYTVQRAWTGFLLAAAARVFRLTFVVEGDTLAAAAPYLLLVRHTSILDTLLPSVFITARYGVRLRFVLKRELLLDPCLDIAGNRLPNYFVARDGKESERDLDGVAALAQDLDDRDAVLIYPEGTRMTAAKRERALARLATTDPSLHQRALALRHTLPPRLGGTLTLLDAAPLDVVMMAHTGFEGFARPADLWSGKLVGTTVRMKLWRVPRAAIPAEREARITWLYTEWQKLDDWVGTLSRGATTRDH